MGLSYTIAAIPTLYKGRQYRSRLEARWAAFFDLCGWNAEYEPFDLGEWSPDFLLRGRHEILVEVKPILAIDVPTIHKMSSSADKIGFKGELLLLGTSPFVWPEIVEASSSQQMIGWLCSSERPTEREIARSQERQNLSPEIAATPWFGNCELLQDDLWLDVTGSVFSFEHSRAGSESGRGSLFGIEYHPARQADTRQKCREIWAAASNAVQWRPR